MGYKHQRETILAKGIELMRQTGYHRTGVQEILKACDIPKGSFYNFFESKEQFTQEAIVLYGQAVLRMMQLIAENNQWSADQKIKVFFTALKNDYQAKAWRQSCLLGNLATEIGSEYPQLAQTIAEQLGQWNAVLSNWLSQSNCLSEAASQFTPEEQAAYLFDGFFGALARMKCEQNGRALEVFFRMQLGLLEAQRA